MTERQLQHRVADILTDVHLGLTDQYIPLRVALAMARAAIAEVRKEDRKEWSGHD